VEICKAKIFPTLHSKEEMEITHFSKGSNISWEDESQSNSHLSTGTSVPFLGAVKLFFTAKSTRNP